MKTIYPKKLQKGDEIRVIAPSHSIAIISQANREIANKRLSDLGLKITFGKNVEEADDFGSSSIKSRVDDLHEAFQDSVASQPSGAGEFRGPPRGRCTSEVGDGQVVGACLVVTLDAGESPLSPARS